MAFIRLEENFRLGHGLDSKRRQRSVLKDGWEFTRRMRRFQAGEKNQNNVPGTGKAGQTAAEGQADTSGDAGAAQDLKEL